MVEFIGHAGESRQLQATHCRPEPAWKGIWTDRKGRGRYSKLAEVTCRI